MIPTHETKEQLATYAHSEWLQHPVTRQVLKNLQAQSGALMADAKAKTTDKDVSDSFFRLAVYGSKTLDAAITQMTDTQTYINITEKHK